MVSRRRVAVDAIGVPIVPEPRFRNFVLADVQAERRRRIILGCLCVSVPSGGAAIALFLASGFSAIFVMAAFVSVAGLALVWSTTAAAHGGHKLRQAQVTVMHAPVLVGESVQARLSASARSTVRVTGIRVAIICEERIRVATDEGSRMNSTPNVMHRITLLEEERIISRDTPIAYEFSFSIPDQAMHQVHLPNAQVNWYLETEINIGGWLDQRRRFQLEIAARRFERKEPTAHKPALALN